ncbi:MAG: hypothetical protein LIP28_04565 [Deltaproteobacteria bacterium]|nr:hypothetical protein [Deltaproteobacteria bacterium]
MTMTGSAATSVVYEPDGLQARFPVPFPVFHADDVRAISVDGVLQTELTNFMVEGLDSEEGVHVKFFTPPSFGPKLVLYRWTKRVQESDYPEGGRFPAKVVETDFDRLVAMAQEIDDRLEWTLQIPRGSDVTPIEYTESLYAAADKARNAANEAAASADESLAASRDARAMAADATGQARSAALMAESAAQSALEAATAVNQGASDASEKMKGVVRLATREEHEAGTSGLAAAPIHVKAMLEDAKDGLLEVVRRTAGLPLLTPVWSSLDIVEPGFLDLSLDNGLLLRSAYPEAWAKIEQALAAGSPAVTDEAAWNAERDGNGGICGRFSTGDGVATFRVPLLGKRAGFDGGNAIYTPMLKMYGAVAEASEANIAALIQQANGKLDTSRFRVAQQYLYARDEKAYSATGGTFTAGAWRTRDLNVLETDIPGSGLANNQITLPAGVYDVYARCPSFLVVRAAARLVDVTRDRELLFGSTAATGTDMDRIGYDSIVMGRIILEESSVLELQHICQSTKATNGFGETLVPYPTLRTVFSELFIHRVA